MFDEPGGPDNPASRAAASPINASPGSASEDHQDRLTRRPVLGLLAIGLAVVGLLAFAFQIRAGWEPCDSGMGHKNAIGQTVIDWQQRSELRTMANSLVWMLFIGPVGAILGIAAAIFYRRWWPLIALALVVVPVGLVAIQVLSGDQYDPWLWRYCGD